MTKKWYDKVGKTPWFSVRLTAPEMVHERSNDQGVKFGYDFTPILTYLDTHKFSKYDFHIGTKSNGKGGLCLGNMDLIFEQLFMAEKFVKQVYPNSPTWEHIAIHWK